MNPENDPNYANRLSVMIGELTKKGAKYYPFDHSNFVEFLANIDEEKVHKIADVCSINKLSSLSGIILQSYATAYWENLARIEAEARLEEEYLSCDCGGNGCSKCNDKEHDND